jgi:hypothetical protein
MYDEPDLTPEDDDIEGVYSPDPDPVTAALNASGFAHRHTVPECVHRSTDARVSGFPEMFERFYFDGTYGRVLVDLLADDTPEILAEERLRRHVNFKTEWCAAHDYRYLPLEQSELSIETIRRKLTLNGDADDRPVPKVSAPASKRASNENTPRRGQIQRPKAAV